MYRQVFDLYLSKFTHKLTHLETEKSFQVTNDKKYAQVWTCFLLDMIKTRLECRAWEEVRYFQNPILRDFPSDNLHILTRYFLVSFTTRVTDIRDISTEHRIYESCEELFFTDNVDNDDP